MPSPRYTDADLPRFERKPLSVTVERPGAAIPPYQPPTGPSIDERIAAAKAALRNAAALTDERDALIPEEEAAFDQRLIDTRTMEAANAAMPSALDSPMQRVGKYAKHYLKTRPEAISAIAPVASLLGGPVGAAAGGLMAGESANRLYQGGMERLSEHPVLSALDASMLAGGGAQAIKALRSLLPGAAAAGPDILRAGAPLRGRPVNPPYRGPREATGPIPQPASSVLRGNRVGGRAPQSALPAGPGAPDALPAPAGPRGLLPPGRQGIPLRAPATRMPPSSRPPSPQPWEGRTAGAGFEGGRSLMHPMLAFGPAPTELAGAASEAPSAAIQGLRGFIASPADPRGSVDPAVIAKLRELVSGQARQPAGPLPGLSNMDRLRARAQERFGRRFYSE